MNQSRYELGETIPGTIGEVVSKTFSYDNGWVYCIKFGSGFLTISEANIDSSIIHVMNQAEQGNNV